MKNLVLLGLLVTVFAASPAFAVKEGGGGDACKQSIDEIKNFIVHSLEYKSPVDHYVYAPQSDHFPEFKMETLKWFMAPANTSVTIVPKTMVNGEETDAENYPDKGQIELNRGRWCALDKENKTKILFHEYLGIMKLEKTNVYSISSRLKVILDPKRFHCELPAIKTSCFEKYTNNLDCGIGFFTGDGATLDDAWFMARYQYVNQEHSSGYQYADCANVQFVAIGNNGDGKLVCLQTPSEVTACKSQD